MTDIVAFESGFTEDPLRRSRWNSFVKKKKAMLQVTLDETINMIRSFLQPVVEATLQQMEMPDHWSHEKLMWE